jgi:predicted phosphodiesterase
VRLSHIFRQAQHSGVVTNAHRINAGQMPVMPMPDAPDGTLVDTYGGRGASLVAYGHIHRPYVRRLPACTVMNSWSVGLPYDGDWRASYLLLEDGVPSIRRVAYDLERALGVGNSASRH